MDEELEKWIEETVSKGTFANREDAIEFCVGATKTFCEYDCLTQESLKEDIKKAAAGEIDEWSKATLALLKFPLKWSNELGVALKGGEGQTVRSAVAQEFESLKIALAPKDAEGGK